MFLKVCLGPWEELIYITYKANLPGMQQTTILKSYLQRWTYYYREWGRFIQSEWQGVGKDKDKITRDKMVSQFPVN